MAMGGRSPLTGAGASIRPTGRGRGEIAGRTVGCTTPELQLRRHLGYRLTDRDRHDLRLLAGRFRLPLPPHVGDG